MENKRQECKESRIGIDRETFILSCLYPPIPFCLATFFKAAFFLPDFPG